MRELLREHGLPVPSFTVCSLHDDPLAIAKTLRYPCVVKPLVLSASCGVIRADTPAEFTAAFHRVFALLRKLGLAAAADDSGRLLLVEDFVSGREVALEGLLTDGKLRVLALFDKPDPLDGPFFEETIYITPSRLPLTIQADIAQCAAHAAERPGARGSGSRRRPRLRRARRAPAPERARDPRLARARALLGRRARALARRGPSAVDVRAPCDSRPVFRWKRSFCVMPCAWHFLS